MAPKQAWTCVSFSTENVGWRRDCRSCKARPPRDGQRDRSQTRRDSHENGSRRDQPNNKRKRNANANANNKEKEDTGIAAHILVATPETAISPPSFTPPPDDMDERAKWKTGVQNNLKTLMEERGCQQKLGRATSEVTAEISVLKRMLVMCKSPAQQLLGTSRL